MLKLLGLIAAVAFVFLLIATGGQLGPVDLMKVPLPLVAFAAVTLVVLFGLRRI